MSGRPTGLELYSAGHQDRFELRKPYFVGCHSLAPARARPGLPEFTWEEPQDAPLKRTPLYEWHKAHTRKVIPFAGWEMPVWYTGVLDEHNAVRKAAGLFDVAHMGVFEVSGPHATEFLDLVCTNYVRWYEPGESFYSYLLDPDGHVIDDLFVYRRGKDLYLMVVNASNADKDWAWLNAVNNGEVLIDRQRPDLRVLRPANLRNLKDPAAAPTSASTWRYRVRLRLAILQSLTDDPRLKDRLARVRKTGLIECQLAGFDLIIARTGYTGEEIGYEIFVHPDRAVAFWETLLEAGQPFGLQPSGLAARDSTRTEAGLPLYGHELAGSLDPAASRRPAPALRAMSSCTSPTLSAGRRTSSREGPHHGDRPLPDERARRAHAQDRRPGDQQEGAGDRLGDQRRGGRGRGDPGPGLRPEPLSPPRRRDRHLQRAGQAGRREEQQGRAGAGRQGPAARHGYSAAPLPRPGRTRPLARSAARTGCRCGTCR